MTVNPIPSPVAANGVAYVMSGYNASAVVAVSLDAIGDVTDSPAVRWRYGHGTPYVPSPVLVNGRLYFTQANVNVLTCLDTATGKPLIDRERLPGAGEFYASPLAAAGRLYFVDRDGTTLVLKQSDQVEVLATNRLNDAVDASPVAVGRQLFLRGAKYLYCIEDPTK
jgi:outer membrane protein assembly factor BamB